MDERAAATLTAAGYDASRHRARTFDAGWHDDHDLVLVMDEANLATSAAPASGSRCSATSIPTNPVARCRTRTTVGLPGFEEVLRMVERTSTSLVAALQHGARPAHDPAAPDRASASRSCSARR